MAYSFEQTKAGYAHLWDTAQIDPKHRAQAVAQANRIHAAAARDILTQVEAATGVPWFMVGVLLYRESDLNFGTYLGNGQSLQRRTTVVPAGRGPFSSFLEGAIDAIKLEGMFKIGPWTLELILYWIERFNGQGYFGHGNSPYLWAWTNLYTGGKFTSDHHFDPAFYDPQGGCVAILKALFEIEPALTPPRIAGEKPPMTMPAPTTAPTMPHPGIDLAQLTHTLETIVNFLPTIAMFFPPLKVAVPFVPLIEGLLKMAEELESAPHDPQGIANIIIGHLQNIGKDIQAVTDQQKTG